MMELLKPTAYSCTNVDEVVVLTVGDKSLKMSYATALRMAAMLFHSGKQAKASAGDNGRMMIGLGTLTDATADALKIQRRRDGTATFLR